MFQNNLVSNKLLILQNGDRVKSHLMLDERIARPVVKRRILILINFSLNIVEIFIWAQILMIHLGYVIPTLYFPSTVEATRSLLHSYEEV